VLVVTILRPKATKNGSQISTKIARQRGSLFDGIKGSTADRNRPNRRAVCQLVRVYMTTMVKEASSMAHTDNTSMKTSSSEHKGNREARAINGEKNEKF